MEVPSVTQILGQLDKPALKQWTANCARDYVQDKLTPELLTDPAAFRTFLNEIPYAWKGIGDKAITIGSQAHDLFKQYIQHGKDAIGKLSEEVENSFLAFLQWEKQMVKRWIDSEKLVYSLEHGFAGIFDAVAELHSGQIYLIDFKTSKALYDEYGRQVAAYAFLYEQTFKKKIDGIGVLRVGKEDGMPEWKDYTNRRQRFIDAYLLLVKYFYLEKKRRFKNNPLAI